MFAAEYRLERKTVKRKRVFATLKVLGTVLEQLSEEIPDEVGFFEFLIMSTVKLIFALLIVVDCVIDFFKELCCLFCKWVGLQFWGIFLFQYLLLLLLFIFKKGKNKWCGDFFCWLFTYYFPLLSIRFDDFPLIPAKFIDFYPSFFLSVTCYGFLNCIWYF